MPDRASLVQRQQAAIEAIGVGQDQIKVLDIQHDPQTGVSYIIAEMSSEMAASVDKLTSLHLHNPESVISNPSIRVNETEFEILGQDGLTAEEAKSWIAIERKKRAKPKKDSGPDRL